MSQNDFNIANQGFPATRADINSALQALASNSAGTTAPSTTYAYQFWYDETNELLKMRNSDNDAWITLAAFDQTNDEWEVRSAVVQAVDAAGVTIKTDDGTTRLTVADDGKVGIGTASPSSLLDILGGGTPLRFTGGGPAATGGIEFYNSTTKVAEIDVDGSNGVITLSVDPTDTISGGRVEFYINGTEKARIDGTGKVYIGRTSDPYMSTGAVKRLAIDGGTTSTDATIVSNKNSASTMYHFYFHNSNSVVGSISTNSYATSFNTSSDYRLKENVVDITGAIERVNALSPKRFNWIDDEENKTVDGFLAHEAAEVVPEAITGTYNETQTAYGVVRDANGKVIAKDVAEEDWSENVDDLYPSGSTWAASEELPVYQSIDQSKLVPLLTAALQEALQKIDALEVRVTALEG